MKNSTLASLLPMLLLSVAAHLEAAEAVELETNIYVFKKSDFSTIEIPGTRETNDPHSVIFSDGVAQFGEETLSLQGSQFTWSSGNPPNRFSLIGTPSTSLTPGKQLTLLSTVPVQYVERRGDGTLKVHEISGDSPEAPHFRLTFTLLPESAVSQDIRLTCLLDIATIASRAKVSGIALEIGKPVLVQFNDKMELTLRPAEWSAFALQAPNGSDYNLLMLLKAVPASASAATTAERKDPPFKSAEEIAKFATYYYQHQQPELIGRLIESLGPTRFFARRQSLDDLHLQFKAVAFFAEIFAQNPTRVAEWRKIIDRQGKDTRFWLNLAFDSHRPSGVDALWGAFFASGNQEYIRRLVDRLAFITDHGNDSHQASEGADIMLSLAYNAPYHPLVRQTLEESRNKAGRASRALIDDLLVKDLPAIRKKVAQFYREAPDYNSFNNGLNTQYGSGGVPLPEPSHILQPPVNNSYPHPGAPSH